MIPYDTHLRFTPAAWAALTGHHRRNDSLEHASIALGRTLCHGARRIVLVDLPGLALLDGKDYARQAGGAVTVNPAVTRRLMWWFAQSDYDAFISIHDHWFSSSGTTFSGGDNQDDLRQDGYLRGRFARCLGNPSFGAPRAITHIAMVFDKASLDARVVDTNRADKPFSTVGSVSVVGAPYIRLWPNSLPVQPSADDETLARHADFVQPAVKRMIGSLRVGIIGCGGLGPLVAENLLRLGVRSFALFDPDILDATNLNRWPSGRSVDIGAPKAALLAARLRDCEPRTVVDAHTVDVLDGDVLPAAGACDLLVSAVDNDAARLWVNRVAAACLIPLFDVGVRVRTAPHIDFLTRIVPVVPAVTACLECSGMCLLNHLEIAKSLDGMTAMVRQATGYVEDTPAAAPSVMGLNTLAAGETTLAILAYLAGLGDGFPHPIKSTWSSAQTVRIGSDSHLPVDTCPSCGSENRGRGAAADVPRRRCEEVVARELGQLFDSSASRVAVGGVA